MTAELEEVDVSEDGQPRPILVAKQLLVEFKVELTCTLQVYRDVFAWSYKNMKGLDPQFYQHKINLSSNTFHVQQRHYRLYPTYAARAKDEIDKCLRVGFV